MFSFNYECDIKGQYINQHRSSKIKCPKMSKPFTIMPE